MASLTLKPSQRNLWEAAASCATVRFLGVEASSRRSQINTAKALEQPAGVNRTGTGRDSGDAWAEFPLEHAHRGCPRLPRANRDGIQSRSPLPAALARAGGFATASQAI